MPVSKTNIESQAALLAVSLILSLAPAAFTEETSEAISQTADLVEKTNLEELGFKEYKPGKEEGSKQSQKPIWVQKADAASKSDCAKKQQPAPKANLDQQVDLGQKADFVGKAAWYSSDLHGKKTASGQPYDESKMTAAHKQLPFGTKVTVVNRKNGKTCTLTINDRGPFVPNHVIDVSKAAAKELGLMSDNKRLVDCYIRIDAKDLIKKQQQNKVKVAAKPEAETL
ncbi:MAG: septal ring lytic transglycosylase RlpA family protein [Candidatus Obscuribacterales bacterium]|nr:septal ring lytic transglycosylase RlpA family protein [Candidatus Obscuribacterales bacterium]